MSEFLCLQLKRFLFEISDQFDLRWGLAVFWVNVATVSIDKDLYFILFTVCWAKNLCTHMILTIQPILVKSKARL
jgi:hypothetical protein